jgi:hypothetical protein
MKKMNFLLFCLFSLNVFSQEADSVIIEDEEVILEAPMKNLEFKITIQLGLDYPLMFKTNNAAHGLDVAARSSTMGYSIAGGMGFEIKRKMGLECSGGFLGFSGRSKYFARKMDETFPQQDVTTDEDLIYKDGSLGADVYYLNPKIYFMMNPAGRNKWIPMVGVMWVKPVLSEYEFALRERGTNDFTKYNLTHIGGKGNIFLHGGFEVRRTFAATGENGRISNLHAALRTSLTYGKYSADYNVLSETYPSPDFSENINVKYEMLLLNVAVIFNIFSY